MHIVSAFKINSITYSEDNTRTIYLRRYQTYSRRYALSTVYNDYVTAHEQNIFIVISNRQQYNTSVDTIIRKKRFASARRVNNISRYFFRFSDRCNYYLPTKQLVLKKEYNITQPKFSDYRSHSSDQRPAMQIMRSKQLCTFNGG